MTDLPTTIPWNYGNQGPRFCFTYLNTIDEVLGDWALQEDWNTPVFEMVMRAQENGYWTAELEIANPGLSLLRPDRLSYCACFEDLDGTMANARMLFRGRVLPPKGAVGMTVRLQVVCAPIDIKAQQLAYCAANLASLPQFEMLTASVNLNDQKDYFEARSEVFTIDPVTHAISTSDILVGDRVVTLPTYNHETIGLEYGDDPAQSVKIHLIAEWTQQANGWIDIAPAINQPNVDNGITTLNADHLSYASRDIGGAIPGDLIAFSSGAGWTMGRGLVYMNRTETLPIATGRVWDTTWTKGQATAGTDEAPTIIDAVTIDVISDEYCTFTQLFYQYQYLYMTYSYSQPRREECTVLATYPLQNIVGSLPEVDLGEVRLGDLMAMWIQNPNPPPPVDPYGNYTKPYNEYIQVQPFNYLTIYNVGDVVTYAGTPYKCVVAGQGQFYPFSINGVVNISQQHPNWVQIPRTSAMLDARQATYLDTPRGLQSVEHAILRARAYLRSRSRYMIFTIEVPWSDGIGITMRDSVSFAVRNGQDSPKTVTGKVMRIERRWTEDEKIIRITAGVSIGTGAAVQAGVVGYNPANGQPINGLFQVVGNVHTPITASGTQDWLNQIYTGQESVDPASLSTYFTTDVTWTLEAQPAAQPVDAWQLTSFGSAYAVLDVIKQNQAPRQLALASAAGFGGQDPRLAIMNNPTKVSVTMRPLVTESTLLRLVDVAAVVDAAPQGIDLTT